MARKSDYGTKIYFHMCFLFAKKEKKYAEKPISKNDICPYHCCDNRTRLRVFSLYVIHGGMFMSLTGESSVLAAINKMGGVPVLGTPVPIWAVVLIEFVLAYTLENLLGSPLSFKFACKNFDPRTTHPVHFETAIISATVAIMCPAMSFIAAFLYYNYGAGFNMWTLLADWLKLVCFNFPFAFFTQLFFIQPFVRTVFKAIFAKDIKARSNSEKQQEKEPVTV